MLAKSAAFLNRAHILLNLHLFISTCTKNLAFTYQKRETVLRWESDSHPNVKPCSPFNCRGFPSSYHETYVDSDISETGSLYTVTCTILGTFPERNGVHRLLISAISCSTFGIAPLIERRAALLPTGCWSTG